MIFPARALGCCLLLILPTLASAQTTSGDDDDAELAALMAALDTETAIVTKTRMNRDFVPGMVTVLDGARLRAEGNRTVWEAMAQIPGVQIELDVRGNPTLTARGINFPFNSGSIQILLNGFPIAREDIGRNGGVLYLPTAHVERIEFVRGPGSVLYGDFAFQGLLNIITRQSGQSVTLGSDSHGARYGHWLQAGTLGDWKYSASLAGLATDSAVLPVGRNAGERRRSGVVQINNGGFTLLGQGQVRQLDPVVGPPGDNGYEDQAWTLAARYERELGSGWSLSTRGQYLANDLLIGGIRTPQGGLNQVFEGTEWRGAAELSYEGWTGHQWLIGIEQLHGNIDRATFVSGQPGPGRPPPQLVVVSDENRRVFSTYLQDQIEIAENLRLTLGLRHDDNDDVGRRTTPRGSLVWQLAEGHVLKTQYAEGYRAPTFFELYRGDGSVRDLDFEVNRTVELSYIYRRPNHTLRATWFRSRVSDMVYVDRASREFDNLANARSAGAELEWSQQIGSSLTLDAVLSYTDAEDSRNPESALRSIATTPKWLSNLAMTWRVSDHSTLGLSWNHVGERKASSMGDGAFDRLDLSAHIERFFHPDLDLRLGLDNAFNARTINFNDSPTGTTTTLFQDRIWWAELSWRY